MIDFSIVQSAVDTLEINDLNKLVILEASVMASAHMPAYPVDCAALLIGVASHEMAEHLMAILYAGYPKEHEIFIIQPGRSMKLKLEELENSEFSEMTCVYIPPLAEGSAFEAFLEIVARLRAPDGCPWDRAQTHASLRTHLLEETYETLAAIDAGDFTSMQEEFGDLLLQIVLQAQIASEEGHFAITQVIKEIYDKIIRRHPHVFGDFKINGVQGVLANWEKLKEAERGEKNEGKGLLDGVPLALPALAQAQEYQDRAARVGFDWPDIQGVLDKIIEEIDEMKHAEDQKGAASELGDLFFVMVNFARWKNMDAEAILREANAKFKRRFAYVESGASDQNKLLTELTLVEMDALWKAGKRRVG